MLTGGASLHLLNLALQQSQHKVWTSLHLIYLALQQSRHKAWASLHLLNLALQQRRHKAQASLHLLNLTLQQSQRKAWASLHLLNQEFQQRRHKGGLFTSTNSRQILTRVRGMVRRQRQKSETARLTTNIFRAVLVIRTTAHNL
jgi:hypothetical protein